MTDLTIETHWVCQSCTNWEKEIKCKTATYIVSYGPCNDPYKYDYKCTCPSFKYRGHCRHIRMYKQDRCKWNSFLDGGEPEDGKCPYCKASVHTVQVE